MFLFSMALPGLLEARIVSYAPVTSRVSIPAVQKRTNRSYALIELDPSSAGSSVGAPFPGSAVVGSLVLYDSAGQREPQRVIPAGSTFTVAAAYESEGGVTYLFVGTNASLSGDNPTRRHRYLLSTDEGRSWTTVPL